MKRVRKVKLRQSQRHHQQQSRHAKQEMELKIQIVDRLLKTMSQEEIKKQVIEMGKPPGQESLWILQQIEQEQKMLIRWENWLKTKQPQAQVDRAITSLFMQHSPLRRMTIRE